MYYFLPKFKLFGILSILIFSIISCKSLPTPTPPESPGPGAVTRTCSLEPLEWNYVVEGFDQEKSLKILVDLQGAINASDKEIMDQNGLKASFVSNFNDIVKATNQKKFSISQEVQDLMVTLRRLGCDIQSGLFDGNLKAAQDKYLEISDFSTELISKLKEK